MKTTLVIAAAIVAGVIAFLLTRGDAPVAADPASPIAISDMELATTPDPLPPELVPEPLEKRVEEDAEPEPTPDWSAVEQDDRFPEPTIAGTLAQIDTGAMNWATVDGEALEARIGQTFTVRMPDSRMIDLVLEEVVMGPVDPARPKALAREQSVTAVFGASETVLAGLNEYGAKSVSIFHPDLGEESVMLGVYPTPTGGKTIEAILN